MKSVAVVATLLALLVSSCETLVPEPSPPTLRAERVFPFLEDIGREVVEAQDGKMSWYSVKTNGGTHTASGERFSDESATAAHKTLPFGTEVKVTNLVNGRSEIVRINNRGPYTRGRIIDVSIGTARKLDFVGRGVVDCRVEVLR